MSVNSSGHVAWSLPLIIKSSCSVDVTLFPFDNQKCQVRFGSAMYDEQQLQLQLHSDVTQSLDLSRFTQNPEFELVRQQLQVEPLTAHAFRQRFFRPEMTSQPAEHLFPYDDVEVVYPQLVLTLFMRRKPQYFMYTIVLPTLVLCLLLIATFLLPCDHGDKVGIGLTVFLSLYVLQLAVAENIPESNSIPLISKRLASAIHSQTGDHN